MTRRTPTIRAATVRKRTYESGTRWLRATLPPLALLFITSVAGCTSESTRIAIESQRRADAVESTIVDRQHEALRILLYRDLTSRLERGGLSLDDAARAALNDAWNDRDLIEWWRVQHERAAALRRAGVDAKLYGDQATIDLLVKSVEAKFDRATSAVAASIAESLAPDAPRASDPTENQ